MNLIFDTWPWYVAGPLIAFVAVALLYGGKVFGFSSNFRHMCSALGAGKVSDFFDYDWKKNSWNLVFLVGTILGGFIGHYFLGQTDSIPLNPTTADRLVELGIGADGFVPDSIFGMEALFSVKGFLVLAVGGFLVGFGTRYAGGCTSGHAISGLANLQWRSLLAVVGFFIGGLISTHFILPHLF
jgi:uncharacterized membrane protein YedE/YeeE